MRIENQSIKHNSTLFWAQSCKKYQKFVFSAILMQSLIWSVKYTQTKYIIGYGYSIQSMG